MKTRKLGWSGLDLTTIGLGTWAIGGGDWAFAWGPQDDNESIQAIRHGLDLGINWIDTAPAYGLGHGEEVVGRALKGLANRPLIATKCGRSWTSERKLFANLKRAVIQAEVEASLRRLQIETIDLYQIHWPQPAEDIAEAWGAMGEMIRQGKIRFAGVCNFDVAQLKQLQAIHPVASLQPPYSMLVRGVENELLDYCRQHQIGVVAYSPMQKGLLTGKFSAARLKAMPTDDHRLRDAMFQEPRFSQITRLVGELDRLAKKQGHTSAQLALAWVLRRPEVTSAIVGVRRPGQIDEIIDAADWELSPEDLAQVETLLGQVLV